MNKFSFTTLAIAIGAMSFAASAHADHDDRNQAYDDQDDYYQNDNNQNYNNQNYNNQNYNNQNYNNQNYNSQNYNGYIQNGQYYNGDQYNHYDRGRYANAKVVRVVPLTRYVSQPRQMVCQPVSNPRYEIQPYGSHQSRPVINAGTITGAVIGGAIGNQVGAHDNRAASTVVGATIGGLIGNAVAQNNTNYHNGYNNNAYNHSNNCYTVPGRQIVQTIGYQVTYRYSGRYYTVRMPYYPERHLRIRVDRDYDHSAQVVVRY